MGAMRRAIGRGLLWFIDAARPGVDYEAYLAKRLATQPLSVPLPPNFVFRREGESSREAP